MKRVHSIDMLRGLVMIIMALDHIRDFVHESSLSFDPTDLSQTSTALFLTRWITHLCAPTFVFLSGVSAFISFQSENNYAKSRKFLLTRGLWLIILDFTVINFGLWFDIHFPIFLFNVLATIGFGFIILALLIKLRPEHIGVIGLFVLVFNGSLPDFPVKQFLTPLFSSTASPFGNGKLFIMGYPPMPWLGIMLMGYGWGKLLLNSDKKALYIKSAIFCLLLFTILRYFNLFGEPQHWSVQKNGIFTILSYLNVSKYPPSLLFCLLMLGIMFLLGYFFEGKRNKFLEVYGKVPLFYFLIHWFILHFLQFAIILSQGFSFSDFVFGTRFGRPEKWVGLSLPLTYLAWITAVLILYPVCKKYGVFKRGKKWLRYL